MAETNVEAKAASGTCAHRLARVAWLPCELSTFVRWMYKKFDGYVPVAMLTYGVNQGMGWEIFDMARTVYMIHVLGMDGATTGRFDAIGKIPWSMKPIFGMLSDMLPLCGYHRSSYLIISGALGCMAASSLGVLELAGAAIVPFLIIYSISVAAPDIIVDAKTAELSKEAPANASDLQSLCWGSKSLGAAIAAPLAGLLVDRLQPSRVFLLCNICALAVFVPGALRMLPEERLPRGQRGPKWEWFSKNATLSGLAVYMTVAAVAVSLLQAFADDLLRASVTVICALVLVGVVYFALRRIAPVLAKAAAFIFLRQCLQLEFRDKMFEWLTDSEDGPGFTPTFYSLISGIANIGFFAAVLVYNKFLIRTSYRKIFVGAQTVLVASNMLDFVFVKRWNLRVGIPDAYMLFGDAAVAECVRYFYYLPMFVLAAKVCPHEIEATLFALLMSLSNFGHTVGVFGGSSLLELLGVVDENWEEFPTAVVIKAFCRLLPIILIPALVPPALTPSDPILLDAEPPISKDSDRSKLGNLSAASEADVDQNDACGSAIVADEEDVEASTKR